MSREHNENKKNMNYMKNILILIKNIYFLLHCFFNIILFFVIKIFNILLYYKFESMSLNDIFFKSYSLFH